MIAINGADSAMFYGVDTIVKTGDTVTIVTIVHGG
jgi:molybdopterin converting factor small subunit